MLRYVRGNLLRAHAEALVNTVNEKGVMGKGIALMFKEAFPHSSRQYELACARGEVRVGRMFVTERTGESDPKWIIHFPTKKHWRNPSKLEWIRDGLKDLVHTIERLHIRSIAVPPLGTGNGKLAWSLVKAEIQAALGAIAEVEITVFEPTSSYQNFPKASGVVTLTPARALIAELIRRYSVLGLECTHLEAQKLGWFLARAIKVLGNDDPLQLEFKADRYGPYSDRLRHLLNSLDGSYLHSSKRMADSKPLDPIWFDSSRREETATFLQSSSVRQYLPALEKTSAVIEGFESPLGLELLATVDWLVYRRHAVQSVQGIREQLVRWPGDSAAGRRKLKLFSDRLLELAIVRLAREHPLESEHCSDSPDEV